MVDLESGLSEQELLSVVRGQGRVVGVTPAQAVERLLQSHYDWLFRMCRFELRGSEAAEDCVQDVMIEIAKGLARFDGRSELKTWMFVIAKRMIYRHRKRFQDDVRRFQHDDRERGVLVEQQAGESEQGNAVQLTGVQTPLDRLLISREQRAQVLELVSRLPERQRLAVLLHYFEDLSVTEGSKQLGCSEGTFKTHLHRARHTLAEWLAEAGIDSREMVV